MRYEMNGNTLLRLTRGNHLYRVYQKMMSNIQKSVLINSAIFLHALHSLLTFSSSKENVFLTRLEAGFPGKKHFPLEKKR